MNRCVLFLVLCMAGCVGADNLPPAKEVTTNSGLKYQDLKAGTGEPARSGDYVTVHYVGMLADGKEFDSSVKHGKPFSFMIDKDQVIKGWHEGLVGMKAGGKRRLTIPPQLAYGSEGSRGAIPPNATLTFDIELLKIE